MTPLLQAVRWTSAVTHALGSVAIGLMMVHVSVHVFFQYALGYPLPGTYLFVSHYYMVVVTFLCLGAVELRGGHISVDILTNAMPLKARRHLDVVARLLTVIVFILLAWQSAIVAEARRAAGSFQVEYGLKILIWPSYYIVPIGAALFALVAFVKLLEALFTNPVDAPHNASSEAGN